jgi:multidrug transporter EmrE-like cation transporter
MLALASEMAAVLALKLSQGFSKRIPALATVVFAVLSLALLSFAFNIGGFEASLIYVFWSGVGIAFIIVIELLWKQGESWKGKEIGPVGSMARIGLGLGLVWGVVHGQLTTHFAPAPWALGLLGFSALALAWHWCHIHLRPAPFHDTSALSIVLGVALPVALYFTWWYAPASSFTSDAILIFVGLSMVLAALRNYAGCEMLAFSNWLLRRRDQLACAFFTPIDSLERRSLYAYATSAKE